MVSRKARVQELASNVRRRTSDPTADAVKELLGLMVDEVKDNLVNSTGDLTLRLQGEAQVLSRLLGLLTKEPPKITQGE